MASVSAKRHAQAVFEIALEKNELDKWLGDLRTVSSILSDPKLAALLENPKIHFTAKARVINEIMPGIGRLPRNLVQLLTAKGRLGLVPDLAREYERLVNAHRGIERAEVIAAVPLTDKQKEKITQQLSSMTGKKVAVDVRIDPRIIGGLMARIGDTLVDGSVRSQLASLRKGLA
ncbi:MAG: ATP synthase F1 subunit delta [Dehalococcoidia bacterium]|nr:ATP synthase F1 subunit delta [Dehalococcoidia bacterium]